MVALLTLRVQQRRRDRGKLAQSAFRKRQAEAKKNIEAENLALKTAIAAILAEVDSDSDRAELQIKVRQAAEIAGLDKDLVTKRRRLGSEISSSSSGPGAVSPPRAVKRSRASAPGSSSPSPVVVSPTNDKITVHRDPFHCYGCTSGAAAVLPFLGAGASTFAGIIFWHLVEKYDNSVHASRPIPPCQQQPRQQHLECHDSSPNSEASEATPRFTDLVSQVLSVDDSDIWFEVVESRMRYYRGKTAQYSVESAAQNNSVAPRETARDWLSPMTAESRIRSIVGDQVFAAMATPAIERWERKSRACSPAMDEPKVLVDGLLDKLSETFVCMGSGPRWHASDFDSMFLEWCSPITGHQVECVEVL